MWILWQACGIRVTIISLKLSLLLRIGSRHFSQSVFLHVKWPARNLSIREVPPDVIFGLYELTLGLWKNGANSAVKYIRRLRLWASTHVEYGWVASGPWVASICKFQPADDVVFVFVFVFSVCPSRNRKSTCKNTAHPHVFVFVVCRSRNLSIGCEFVTSDRACLMSYPVWLRRGPLKTSCTWPVHLADVIHPTTRTSTRKCFLQRISSVTWSFFVVTEKIEPGGSVLNKSKFSEFWTNRCFLSFEQIDVFRVLNKSMFSEFHAHKKDQKSLETSFRETPHQWSEKYLG